MDGGTHNDPVQQPEPADAVPRRAAGVQGGDQLAAGPLRPPRGLGRQRGHQVRHQHVSTATPSSSSATTTSTRATSSRRRATASSATSSAARSAARCSRTSCSSSAATRARSRRANPPDDRQLRADRGDAGRRLHARSRARGVQRRRTLLGRAGFVNNRIDPSAFSPIALEVPEARAGLDRSRAAASSTASRTTTPSTRRSARGDYTLSHSQNAVRPLPVRASTTTRRPTTARTR